MFLLYWLFIKCVDPRIKARKSAELTYCNPETRTIYLGEEIRHEGDLFGFLRHIEEWHFFNPFRLMHIENYPFAMWAILHEIGHIALHPQEFSNGLVIAALASDMEDPNVQDWYYNTDREYEATEWALDWIEAHPRKAKFFEGVLSNV